MEFRQDIQILRGLAVLFVVLYHLQVPFFQNGYLGVDIFFVISGFLMAKLYDRGTITDFYKRRIDRLFPAYAVAIIVTLVAGAFLLIPPDFNQLFQQSLYSIFFSGNFYFWNQNSYFNYSEFNPLLNLWSLGVEVQFYLIVPFLYPFLRRRLWLISLLVIASFFVCIIVQHISPKTSFFLMPFRIWEFLIGAIVAWNFNFLNLKNRAMNVVRYGFPLLILVCLFWAPIDPSSRDILIGHPSFFALIICLLTAVMIAVGLPAVFEKNIIGKAAAVIGDYSYSIYLVHFPLIVIVNYQIFGGTILNIENLKDVGLVLVLMAFLSFLSYQYVEKRGGKLFNTNLKRLSLLGCVVIVCFVTFQLNYKQYTSQQQNIFAAIEDRSTYRCGKIFRLFNPTQDICPIGGAGYDRNVLLVGDSHADAIKTTFAGEANAQNIGVFFYVDNNPLVSDSISADKIIADAIVLNIKNIVLHFNHNAYKREKFLKQLLRLEALVREKSLNLSIIAPVPTYDLIIPKAMYDLGGEVDNASFTTNRADHYKKIADFLKISNDMKARNIPIVDPAITLCPKNSQCLFSDNALHPFYFDSHHLTLKGTSKLSNDFKIFIKGLF